MRPESQEILPRGIQFTHQLRLWKGMNEPGGIHTRLQGLFVEHCKEINRGKVKRRKALKGAQYDCLEVRLLGGRLRYKDRR